jgi:radical SAM superfamily enzyme YgiQ (UPF0313 family)
MSLIEPIIRPPSEADSFLLQVTVGCSADTCIFCGAYQDKPFGVQDINEIAADIKKGSRRFPETRRVFLLDGDALVLKNEKLLPVLEMLLKAFPDLSRIASYANGYNITKRSDAELKELFLRKLSLIYLGLESGSQQILDLCRKKSTAEEMIAAVRKAEEAGIKSSVIVLLGLGGKKNSKEHVAGTVDALNRMQPRYLSFLSLMVIPGTVLDTQVEDGDFEELTSKELLKEARDILAGLDLEKTIFRSNHASNYLSLEGRFPKDKERLLTTLESAINGKLRLKPEFLRAL